ncbi:Hypothetical protein GbCGDNIH2_7098 [Granulibacter bethesdensis]|uniref:Uncharacterized protein n=1 Tax=Granulibacter bethesdensis (strain ATCC BAA-1260 / CGDNIH1) TaxID=391165 RepID=A0A286M362_GRABC|nr:Hypothetical protein GbCGDNIH2_7098 [Granulibacter bethesdensis]APH52537.1 Hypothetical protein GbCGDNIH5_7098a [Granulibacter bethesdensis]APH65226.1 Hypothetical protein GbCGDNIH1I4_7098 [Granulibacter bethesdensis]ASV62461.1 Hypothetical protein GbCGDNIH1_7098a [Granulibacter bethesdensis CGDNIH1]
MGGGGNHRDFVIGKAQRDSKGRIGLRCVHIEPFSGNLFPIVFAQNGPSGTEKPDCCKLVKLPVWGYPADLSSGRIGFKGAWEGTCYLRSLRSLVRSSQREIANRARGPGWLTH